MSAPLTGPVHIIGCGLIGTSLGLALVEYGLEVHLEDIRRSNVELAVSLGAGTAGRPQAPQLVIVSVPPAVVSATVVAALAAWPSAVVTDVASVKAVPLADITTAGDAARYVGSHPMAGSERSGPMAASSQLFEGRAWAVAAHERSSAEATALVHALASAVGSTIVDIDADTHDEAVALVSHLPHLMSVLTAAQLSDAPAEHLSLAGAGLRDVVRIAGSDPGLWLEIINGNAGRIAALLRGVRDDLDSIIDDLDDTNDGLAAVLSRGRDGNLRVPGKHGVVSISMDTVFVQVPDTPGELSRLMADAGESGINIEDIRIDHDPARAVGLVEVVVRQTRAQDLVDALVDRGWSAQR